MSDSVRPHRRQPTRLPRPWDSPGKNIGVGCHFLLQCKKVKSESEVTQSCRTLSDSMDCSLPGSSVHGIFQARVLDWSAIAFSPVQTLKQIFSVLTGVFLVGLDSWDRKVWQLGSVHELGWDSRPEKTEALPRNITVMLDEIQVWKNGLDSNSMC